MEDSIFLDISKSWSQHVVNVSDISNVDKFLTLWKRHLKKILTKFSLNLVSIFYNALIKNLDRGSLKRTSQHIEKVLTLWKRTSQHVEKVLTLWKRTSQHVEKVLTLWKGHLNLLRQFQLVSAFKTPKLNKYLLMRIWLFIDLPEKQRSHM